MIQDLRYGVRMLLNRPGFSVSAIVALAVGIGPITGCGFCSALHPGASRDEDRSHNGASERVSLSILDFGFWICASENRSWGDLLILDFGFAHLNRA